jgi:toxoflavin biosynthesis protein ToxD
MELDEGLRRAQGVSRARSAAAALLVGAWAGCGGGAPAMSRTAYHGGEAPMSRAADDAMIVVAAGRFIAGSTPEEREEAYSAALASAGDDRAREGRWFEAEADRHVVDLPTYRIDIMPVTNAAYAEFLADGGTTALPAIDEATWKAQGFAQDWATEVARFNWTEAGPPPGRADHPVVLVTWTEADAYCRWRGALVGAPRRLPTEAEFEKAARGDGGLAYPWGNVFEADKLVSAEAGPGDTMAVGSHPEGKSPYGMLDAAGNVFQWTSTPWPEAGQSAGGGGSGGRGRPRMIVKGSAWEDHAGVGRGASRHGRPREIRHAIVGFRCAGA